MGRTDPPGPLSNGQGRCFQRKLWMACGVHFAQVAIGGLPALLRRLDDTGRGNRRFNVGRREELEGYLVDQACLRKYPQDQLLARAREHTRECALMGHCVESGYGLVDDDGRPLLLEAASTPEVVLAVRDASRDHGIRLRVTREMEDGEMRTTAVREV